MTERTLTEELKREARRVGFDAVGVARVGSIERDARALSRWLDEGMHASMSWMSRDPQVRQDPRELLQGCRSVVALAINYLPPSNR